MNQIYFNLSELYHAQFECIAIIDGLEKNLSLHPSENTIIVLIHPNTKKLNPQYPKKNQQKRQNKSQIKREMNEYIRKKIISKKIKNEYE